VDDKASLRRQCGMSAGAKRRLDCDLWPGSNKMNAVAIISNKKEAFIGLANSRQEKFHCALRTPAKGTAQLPELTHDGVSEHGIKQLEIQLSGKQAVR